MSQTMLVVEYEERSREQIRKAFSSTYIVLVAEERMAAVALANAHRPSLIIMNLRLGPTPDKATEGLAALEELLSIDPLTKVVVILENGNHADALRAVQLGASACIHRPVQAGAVQDTLERAACFLPLERKHRVSQEEQGAANFKDILGTSATMQRVFTTIRRVADYDVPVLITGESGTGKGLVAHAIHTQSRRQHAPFIAINCGAIPDNLLESELFGHEKGAFTGAHIQRKGRIESAHRGVLFLDEIGELPLPLQVKLLHVLQEQRIVRVGGREEIAVDARIIAATNRDLAQAILDGVFRKDLFFRFQVVSITVPPLRERGPDIVLLAQAILQRCAHELKRTITRFTRDAVEAMQAHDWPGNVREMENRIKRAVIMAVGPHLTSEDLEMTSMNTTYVGQTLKDIRQSVEQKYIQQTLVRCDWNITKAALALGVSRPTLHGLISKYSIKR
ncbi:MAG: PEP-CTERM-box response regulator transcription factor [Nitrospira sp.]|nr:PEP-CTERM-box response regulator transcription factor [Nitrospira sp.]